MILKFDEKWSRLQANHFFELINRLLDHPEAPAPERAKLAAARPLIEPGQKVRNQSATSNRKLSSFAANQTAYSKMVDPQT